MPARTTAPPRGEDREVIRLVAPVALWWVWVAFVVLNIADFAIQGLSSARFGAVISAVLLFVTGLAYTLALRPRVVTDTAGITVVNPYRTHRVPWPLIQSVDTGEWVRLRYSQPEAGTADPDGQRAGDSRPDRTLYCWALFVSSRAKRKIARGPRPQRRGGVFGRAAAAAGIDPGAAQASRLPEEARHLASLPVAQAIATRLDTRAARERARRAAAGQPAEQATASWSISALAAAVIPALVLLVVAVT